MKLLSWLRSFGRRPAAELPDFGRAVGLEADERQPKKTRQGNQIFKIRIPGATGVRREFVSPHVDFSRIDQAYNAESYVRRALDKHIELMFKAGWDLVGKNPKAVDYLKLRLRLVAEVTNIPTDQLLFGTAEDLVKYSNALIVKKRQDDILPPGVKAAGLDERPPVVGYFPFNVNWAEVECDTVGNVFKWRFNVPDAKKPLEPHPRDVIHIYYRREKGRIFATPFLVPALSDIVALRQMEEAVLKLVYRNLYPFLHHKIGSEKEGYEGTDEEVIATRLVIENMDLEAGLVTTERHNITPVALNEIIDARDYLAYFERRLFTGLNVSETIMGRGATANRSTADNQAADLRDTVEAFQKVLETFIDEFWFKELLMEGGYDPVLKPDDMVYFRFKEIDMDTKIKVENHAVYKYITNTITEDEMRDEIGRDIVTDKERARMFCNLVTIPVAQATGKSDLTPPAQPAKAAGDPKKEDSSSSMGEVFTLLSDRLHSLGDEYLREAAEPGGHTAAVLVDLAATLAQAGVQLARAGAAPHDSPPLVSELNAKVVGIFARSPDRAAMHGALDALTDELRRVYVGQES